MCFPLERTPTNIETPYKAVALDPGVRTFQTFYSEEGLVGKIGNGTTENLKRKYKLEDKLKSKISQLKEERRLKFNLRKRCFRLRTKVKNIVLDLHRKTCNWLTSTFKYVFLPSFNVKKMIKKLERKIGKNTVRAMLSLSHYKFKERLKETGKVRGCQIDICNEAYTTKTCGQCGEIDYEFKDEEEYNCKKCLLKIDRDYNAARNIYLKQTQTHDGSGLIR